ncbi:hypothetical protein VTO42DRAFT_292 [Malbranchea cinnamomea]
MKQSTPFQKEAWTEYGLGVVILLLRIFARTKVVGIRNWKGDDFFAILALAFWTAELCMLELIGQNGTNIGLSDEQRASLTDEEHARLVFGSKCLLAGWCCYSTLIWCLKACMLFFYHRLTLGLFQQKMVRITAVACALTYVVVIVVILAHCRPIHKNWQVNPNPGEKCTLDVENYITIAVTNLSTDAALVCIPLPLLRKVKIPLYRKIVIGILLCSGVFVMVATLLRCILSLKDVEGINNSTIWAIRETFVGLICVNAPCIKPLFSQSTWNPSSSDPSSQPQGKYGLSGTGGSYSMPTLTSKSKHAMWSSKKNSAPVTELGDHCSEESILRERRNEDNVPYGYSNEVSGGEERHNTASSTDRGRNAFGGIQVTTTYEIERSGETTSERMV